MNVFEASPIWGWPFCLSSGMCIRLLFFPLLISATLLLSCNDIQRNHSHPDTSPDSIREGKKLAVQYCQGCHLLPTPDLADARSWEKGILPAMGPRLGIFRHNFELYPSSIRDTHLTKGFYPARPLMNDVEWQEIIDYYTATSPDSLPGQSRAYPIADGLSLFKVRTPDWRLPMPAMTLVKIDTSVVGRSLLAYDIHAQHLYHISPGLQILDSFPVKGGLVDLLPWDSGWMACNIGVLNPNNGKFGKLERASKEADGKLWVDTTSLLTGFQRPVQLAQADLNQDGKPDIVICEFGNLTGALSWLENKGNGAFVRHVIRAVPGAIRVSVGDFNHDGLVDIMALFAQGDEGIFLFTNKGGGRFEQRSLLRFPPSYGSTYFEMDDMNKDGYPDIVYVCGDNADFSRVLKPYHGVYVFLNDGHYNFTQRYFFPINGCYKAIARDFDGDGDLDIATISFFPDTDHQPEEGFVYLENRGNFDFKPYSLPAATQGKWLTMDAGDIDGDGRPDLVLGNFSYYAKVTKAGVDFTKGPPFIVLMNTGSSGGK